MSGVRRYIEKSGALLHEEEKLLSKLQELSGQPTDFLSAVSAFESVLPEASCGSLNLLNIGNLL